MTPLDAVLPACGCCQAVADGPSPIENRPGLASLAYRVGTHGRFRRRMLARFPTQPELRPLTARSDDDPSVALVDAWATVLDVVTFYEERIANEGFLRTATEQRSVYELAAEIGYQPRPGVAASGPLAFELETGLGAPPRVAIPKGVKVQSVPGPDEKPQTFETTETIEARPEWNGIPIHAADRRLPKPRDTEAWLAGTATNLQPGDGILLVGRERDENAESDHWDFRQLTDVDADASLGITRVAWARGLGWRGPGHWVDPAASDVRCFAFRQRAALFGAAAPDWKSLPTSFKLGILGGGTAGGRLEASIYVPQDWPGLKIDAIAAGEDDPKHTIFLDAIYPRLVAGSWIVLQRPGYMELYRPKPSLGANAIADDARTGFTLSAKTTRVVVEGENLIEVFNAHVRDTVAFIASEELALAATPIRDPVEGRTVEIDDPLDGFELGRTVLVHGPRARLVVPARARPLVETATGAIRLQPRDVLTVMGPSTPVGGTRSWPVRTAGGANGVVKGPVGHEGVVPVAAPADVERIAEACVVDLVSPVTGEPGRSTIRFTEPLANVFDRGATVIHANVAPATHGESRTEILGSGDGSIPFQRFELKQKPVTFVPARTTSGAATTLAVDIDAVAWSEAPGLDQLGPREHAYVTQIADDGTATVQFGDGRLGSRLPTGVENVRATYRVGVGAVGNLAAGQLSLLMTRPLGTRNVTNPLPTTGGADPEGRDTARVNAPRTVLTFDRVVSLDDYANLARSFAGIGKSEARWVWEGRRRVILVTVAGTGGMAISQVPTLRDLAGALRDAGDRHQAVRIRAYESRTFDVDAGVYLAEGHDWDRVAADVRSALLDRFSFERRALGQAVSVSEVGSAIQGVAGVLAADLDADGIRFTGEAPPKAPILVAETGRAGPAGPRPAQLITINPAPGGIHIARRL